MTARDRLIIVVRARRGRAGRLLVPRPRAQAQGGRRPAGADRHGPAAARRRRSRCAAQARTAKAATTTTTPTSRGSARPCPRATPLPSLLYQLQSAAHDARIDFRSLKVWPPAPGRAPPPSPRPRRRPRRLARAPGRIDGARRRRRARARHPGRRPPRCLPARPSARPASRPCRSPSSSPAASSTWRRSCTRSRASSACDGKRIDVSGRLLSVDAFSLDGGRRPASRSVRRRHRDGLPAVARRRVDHDHAVDRDAEHRAAPPRQPAPRRPTTPAASEVTR